MTVRLAVPTPEVIPTFGDVYWDSYARSLSHGPLPKAYPALAYANLVRNFALGIAWSVARSHIGHLLNTVVVDVDCTAFIRARGVTRSARLLSFRAHTETLARVVETSEFQPLTLLDDLSFRESPDMYSLVDE